MVNADIAVGSGKPLPWAWTGVAEHVLLGVLAIVGAIVGSAGWAGQMPDVDMVPYFQNARAFATDGTWPVLGNVMSFGGINPPGASYLMLPGALLFDDVRAWHLPGSIAAYLLLVLGARLVLGLHLTPTQATLGAIGLALSAGAIATAGTLWTRMQSPMFLTWTLYFLIRWAGGGRRREWWLAAALLCWSASVYVFPETLLAAVLFVAVYAMRRPPLRIAPIAAAAIATLAFAWPYARYEARHGFRDVAAIIAQRKLSSVSSHDRSHWRDPSREVRVMTSDGSLVPEPQDGRPSTGILPLAISKVASVTSMLRANLARNGASAPVLAALALVTMGGAARGAVGTIGAAPVARRRMRRVISIVAGVVCLVVAAAFSGGVVRLIVGPEALITEAALFNLALARVGLAVVGVALLVPAVGGRVAARAVPALPDAGLAIVAVPTLLLVLATLAVAVPGRPDRLWQAWPLLVVTIVIGTDRRMQLMRFGLRARTVAIFVLGVMLAFNATLLGKVEWFARHGWAGPASPWATLLDVVAADALARREQTVRVGHRTGFPLFEVRASAYDPRARLGAGGDAYLLNRYGLKNLCTAPEGIEEADQWRVIGAPAIDEGYITDPSEQQGGWQRVAEAPPLWLVRREPAATRP